MNEYLEKVITIQGKERFNWDEFPKNINIYEKRFELIRQYAFAIPNDDIINYIASLNRSVVEIGAGSGYWGMLLREKGVTCHLYEQKLLLDNYYKFTKLWTDVKIGTIKNITNHNDSILFLCWPPMSRMAYNCLRRYKGDMVIYIGEEDGGCTADPLFFRQLEVYWEEINIINIPQWYGIHDNCHVFKRK